MYDFALKFNITKSPKQVPNCLKIAETSVFLIVFIGIICNISAYLLNRFFLSLYMNQVLEMLY